MFSQALIFAAYALGAAASTTTESITPTGTITSAASMKTEGTATIWDGIMKLPSGFAAKVISADPCETTYRLACTDKLYCNTDYNTFDVTSGPTDFQFVMATTINGAGYDFWESCALVSKHSTIHHAVCHQSGVLSVGSTATKTTSVVTIPASSMHSNLYAITSGSSWLAAAAGATCTASGNAAAATGVRQVYKVLVVPAAAAALAAGGML